MATETLTPADVLRKAKGHIELYGWKQLGWGLLGARGRTGDPVLSKCIALACDMFNRDETVSTQELLGFDTYDDAAIWNDAAGRTVDEVLALLDERIAFYEPAAVAVA